MTAVENTSLQIGLLSAQESRSGLISKQGRMEMPLDISGSVRTHREKLFLSVCFLSRAELTRRPKVPSKLVPCFTGMTAFSPAFIEATSLAPSR